MLLTIPVHQFIKKKQQNYLISNLKKFYKIYKYIWNLFNYNLGALYYKHYSRYSMDGVFPTTGNYFRDNVDSRRWDQISTDLHLRLKDWRSTGDHILLACQRNGGWSMQNLKVTDWISSTVTELRKHTDRPIIVRGHPGDKQAIRYLKQKKKRKLN